MADIFVNLKRFDVPRQVGGLCPDRDPQAWIKNVIQTSLDLGLGNLPELRLAYLLPEGLVAAARQVLAENPAPAGANLFIGCQGVHWKDVEPGQNFGAFTTSLPAQAAAALGCQWSIIGHSEERRAKLQVIEAYDPALQQDAASYARAQAAVDALIRDEVHNALRAGLSVLLCVGETAAERGEGDFAAQKPRIQTLLKKQLLANLEVDPQELQPERIVIGYEPIWAIGPGKTPPGAEYIAFVADTIRQALLESKGFTPRVIYGGGLKEENAAMIARIPSIAGGLVALTRFTGEIGFDVSDLKQIVTSFLAAERS